MVCRFRFGLSYSLTDSELLLLVPLPHHIFPYAIFFLLAVNKLKITQGVGVQFTGIMFVLSFMKIVSVFILRIRSCPAVYVTMWTIWFVKHVADLKLSASVDDTYTEVTTSCVYWFGFDAPTIVSIHGTPLGGKCSENLSMYIQVGEART